MQDKIDEVLDDIEDAKKQIRRGHIWTAYRRIKRARDCLYFIEMSLAHKSVRAAMDWGCGIRMPDGTYAVIEDPLDAATAPSR